MVSEPYQMIENNRENIVLLGYSDTTGEKKTEEKKTEEKKTKEKITEEKKTEEQKTEEKKTEEKKNYIISNPTYWPNEIAKFKNPKKQPDCNKPHPNFECPVLDTACQKIRAKSYEDRIERWPDVIDAVFYAHLFSISDSGFVYF